MTALIDLFENEKYIRLSDLNSRKTVSLVKERETNRLLVRRTVDLSCAEMYRKLKQNSLPHIPKIYGIEEVPVPCDSSGKEIEVGFSASIENSQSAGRREAAEEDSPVFYVYEEYIEGRTLEQILSTEGFLREETAVDYMQQLCEVLSDLHELQIIHRDIKPENLIIRASGFLYLIDFDISRIYTAEKTSDTVLMGTQGYASPEQYGFRESDYRSDLYSACVLFNVMLTGTFPAKSIELERKPHNEFWQIIRKGTSMEPSVRYRSARDLDRAVMKAARRVKNDRLWKKQRSKAERPDVPLGFSWTYIPGFRSRTVWKMISASIVYTFVLLVMAFLLSICVLEKEMGADYFCCMSAFYIHWIGVYVFLFNVFNIRSCFRITRNATSALSYIVRSVFLFFLWWSATFCIAVAVVSIASSFSSSF